MPEEEEIEALIERAKRRLDAAYYLFKEGFYEDAVAEHITACTLQRKPCF